MNPVTLYFKLGFIEFDTTGVVGVIVAAFIFVLLVRYLWLAFSAD
jgi:hypothetical protein